MTPPPPDLRAIQMGRLWQLGRVTASLGHDFAQPLNIIRLTAEAALDALDHNRVDPERIRRSLNTLVKQTQRMEATIDTLYAATCRPYGPAVAVAPVESVRRALAAHLPKLRAHGIRLIWHADLATPKVQGHGRRLELAMGNLLANAINALAGTNAGPAILRVSCHGQGDEAHITVDDNGPGLPAALQATLHSPMPEPGAGLGLTIALGVVAEMGGTIAFETRRPGTRITLRLPRAILRQRSVLVVSGNSTLGDTLTGLGWRVGRATHPDEARHLAGPWDAALLDLPMNAADDWRQMEALHAHAPDTAIIAILDDVTEHTRHAVSAGAVLVLHRPVELGKIAQELDELIGNDVQEITPPP